MPYNRMAGHKKAQRKSHRKSHRKANRKSHRKANRKSHRKSQRGGYCAARPLNRQVFERLRSQRGGTHLAPFNGPALFLDNQTMVQAQSAGQIAAIEQSGDLARAYYQQSGSGRRRSQRQRSQRHQRSQRRQRQQRGGMAPFNYELLTPPGADKGMNVQFRDEASVNSLYGETKGAQGY